MQDHRRRDQLIAAALAALGAETANLVRIGRRITLAFTGGPALAFLPWRPLWLAKIGGAVAGALAWPLPGLANLGVAAAVAAGLALLIDL